MVNIIILSIILVIIIGVLIYFIVNRKKLKIKLLEEEASKGNPETLLALGLMLYSGVKIDVDKEKGAEYIKKAAEAGNAQAQYLYSGIILGAANEKELTNEQLREAAMWIEKSAEGGFLTAMTTLANMYAEGKILPKNIKKAQYYFMQAAMRGDMQSQVTVAGYNHFSIDGNKLEAYAWYKTAESYGSEYAKETAEKLYSELSDEDKVKAHNMADEYIIKYGKAILN